MNSPATFAPIMVLLRILTFAVVGLLLAARALAIGDSARFQRLFDDLTALPEVAEHMPRAAGERLLHADVADGRLDSCDLVSAALRIERLGAAVEARCAGRFDAIAAGASRRVTASRFEQSPALIFDYLHEQVLTGGFAADCHRLSRTLETGDFNCLTGTLLYLALARRAGLQVQAALAPAHVCARVTSGKASIDVETTCPRWFAATDDQRRQWLADALGAQGMESPACRVVGDGELLAVVYYNRGVDRFGRREFAAAAADMLAALRLDPASAVARENLFAAINNWGLQLAAEGNLARARQVLAIGREAASERPDLRASQRYVANLVMKAASDRVEHVEPSR